MTATAPRTRQALVQLWLVQIVGTLVLCGVGMMFARSGAVPPTPAEMEWKRYVFVAVLGAAAPALFYLRHYKQLLDYDALLERKNGAPDPTARAVLARALTLGGVLCDIPMAVGAIQMLLGGEVRWFLGGTMITLALRLSFRPFTRRASKP
jgi:hypothetical protein